MFTMKNGNPMVMGKGVLIAVALSLCLGGCWDNREIEEQTLVVGLAIDKYENGIETTIQAPIPVKVIGSGGGDGGGEGGQDAVQLLTARGEDLSESFQVLQNKLNQGLSFGHMRLVVISEELAREGLEDLVDGLGRLHDVRRHMWPIVVEGKAAKALEAELKMEQIPANFLFDMVETGVRDGRMIHFTYGRFLSKLRDKTDQPILNVFNVENESVSWSGTALFRNNRMVKKLDEGDSWILMQLREGKNGSGTSVPCPKQKAEEISFEPRKMKHSITFSPQPLSFQIHILIDGIVTEKTCGFDLSNERHIEVVEDLLRKRYEQRARNLIRMMQEEDLEVFRLGERIRAYHPRLWERVDWQKQFRHVPIDVNYTVNIQGRGAKYK